jgi:FkbM family methyltransferase
MYTPACNVAPPIHASSMTNIIRVPRVIRRAAMRLARNPDLYLRSAKGVVHIGANIGQERDLYDLFDLDVLWVEPIPEVFAQLQVNIEHYPKQQAVKALVTDQDDEAYTFNVASNAGESSSIFGLKDHRDIWPDITIQETIDLRSTRLDSLLGAEKVGPGKYDALVMDTQGSELLVLQGASELLQNIQFIKTEAADFEAYEGCCVLQQLTEHLEKLGFAETVREQFATRSQGGSYYNVIYRKMN